MFNTNLKNVSLAILQHVHWLCWCYRSPLLLGMKNPDSRASHNCTEDSFLLEYILLPSQTFCKGILKLQAH